jgi:50S ribosomal protein L16 3-hydroxylase
MPVDRFMREVWQRRPLLIRHALPGFRPPVGRDALFALARRDDAEARLVTAFGGRWTLRHGPLARLPSTRRSRWTLLVQGVDLLDDDAHALLARFRFVPDARLDDLMASYATDGGGVGPHVDSYDVFLLQASGRRRWRISRQKDLALVPDAPLKRLAGFRPDQEWTVEPGDLLYLPPGVAHEGIALGECVTYSIGFRAPTFQELLDPWLADYATSARLPGRYADRDQPPTRRPAELPHRMVARVHAALAARRPQRTDTRRFLLRYLTEPKAQVVFRRPSRPGSVGSFARRVARSGVVLDRCTRMLYAGTELGINGEWLPTPRGCGPAMQTLANERAVPPPGLALMPGAGIDLLHAWYAAGWLQLARERTPA